MNNNWIINLLEKALTTWNSKLAEIWTLLTTSPENFMEGRVWAVIQQIYGAIQSVGYALLILFFLVGVLHTTLGPQDLRRPETIIKLFLRLAVSKYIISYGMDILIWIMQIPQGMVSSSLVSAAGGTTLSAVLPDEMKEAITAVGFLNSIPLTIVALLSIVLITVLSFILILTVYGRFFRFYMFAALAPIPLAGLAGEGTHQMAWGFFKNYFAVCVEVLIIAIACTIYSAIVSSPPAFDAEAEAVIQVWDYMCSIIFNMLVLVGTVKMCDRMSHELLGI